METSMEINGPIFVNFKRGIANFNPFSFNKVYEAADTPATRCQKFASNDGILDPRKQRTCSPGVLCEIHDADRTIAGRLKLLQRENLTKF
jgi:hypothetical protein